MTAVTRPTFDTPEYIAYCPEHGLHGAREDCFTCMGPVEQVPMVEASSHTGHRVELRFDDGVYAKLLCPDDGSCELAQSCASCGRAVEGDEGFDRCLDCPGPANGCWVRGWFENLTAEELLRGTFTVDVDVQWDGESCVAEIKR